MVDRSDLQWVRVLEAHKNTVSGLINRSRDRETMFVENLGVNIRYCVKSRSNSFTFIKAHSFCAAKRDMYIHEADFRFPR